MQESPVAVSTIGARPCTSLAVPIGMATLARLAFHNVGLTDLHAQLTARCAAGADPSLLLDLATLHTILGDVDSARHHQAQALAGCRLFHRNKPVRPGAVRLLAVMASGDLMANTPLEILLEGSDVTLQMVYCRPGEALPCKLPPHDVLFVAIGESDEHRSTLEILSRQLANWPVPVVNRPEAIARLGRQDAAALLQGCTGLAVPRVVRTMRKDFVEFRRLVRRRDRAGTTDLLACRQRT